MKLSERDRLYRLLDGDKEEMNEESRRAATADLMRVASEYFECDGAPQLEIVREKKGYGVRFFFHAVRVKNFGSLR